MAPALASGWHLYSSRKGSRCAEHTNIRLMCRMALASFCRTCGSRAHCRGRSSGYWSMHPSSSCADNSAAATAASPGVECQHPAPVPGRQHPESIVTGRLIAFGGPKPERVDPVSPVRPVHPAHRTQPEIGLEHVGRAALASGSVAAEPACNPISAARAASSARDRRSSFSSTRWTWFLAVFSAITSCSAT